MRVRACFGSSAQRTVQPIPFTRLRIHDNAPALSVNPFVKVRLSMRSNLVRVAGVMSLAVALAVLGLWLPSVKAQSGTLTPLLPAPAGENVFLRFLESWNTENFDTGKAYYDAVDPYGKRTNLKDWLVVNGFLASSTSAFGPGTLASTGDENIQTDAMAVYQNAADLGFGRRMYLRRNADGALASYVENYGDDAQQFFDADLADEDQILDNASTRRKGLLATVAMEYVAPDDEPNGEKRVTFYTFGGNGQRTEIANINLDGRGDKANPGVCLVCHGGKPQPVVGGIYPNKGDTGARFLPWDVGTLVFGTDPRYGRTAQEPAFKNFNAAVRDHHTQARTLDEVSGLRRQIAPVELINGWYGGPTLPNDTFDDSFVPRGWRPSEALGIPAGSAAIYRDVIGPTCRSCHAQRDAALDFATYKGFAAHRDTMLDVVYEVPTNTFLNGLRPGDEGAVMPLALRTYVNFWETNGPQRLRNFIRNIPH
jgi:mono/diheme cytochrome c family protein